VEFERLAYAIHNGGFNWGMDTTTIDEDATVDM
jgi:hypothetical protein